VTDWPKPTWEPLGLGCRACGHEWDGWQPSMVPFDVAVACLRAQRCPECRSGSEELVIRPTPIAEPEASKP
jgi:hypothetical protein